MTTTVYSPCAPSTSGMEVAVSRQLALPAYRCPTCGSTTPPFDPELLSDLIWSDPAAAARLLATLDDQQRRYQADSYARWLVSHHLPTTPDEVLAGWHVTLFPLARPGSDPPLEPATLSDLLQLQPQVATAILAALSDGDRARQAKATAAWLTGAGSPTAPDDVLRAWGALLDGAALATA